MGRGTGPFPAPRVLRAFPDAIRAPPKTPRRGGGGLRKRWKDEDRIYEWDYQHGSVEVYDSRGNHIGEYDPDTGRRVKGPNPDYKVEP
jgi:hypothetical protein